MTATTTSASAERRPRLPGGPVVLTVGAGCRHPSGDTVLPSHELMDKPRAEQLVAMLNALPAGVVESWWSPILWARHVCRKNGQPDREHRDGHRCGHGWYQAHAAVVDADFYGPEPRIVITKTGIAMKPDHAVVPAERAAAFAALATGGALPGTAWHPSPRGARVVFVFSAPCRNAEIYQLASRGAAELVRQAIDAAGLLARVINNVAVDGFMPDGGVHDLARFMYAPRALVGGLQRDAVVELLRTDSYDADELAAAAPPEPDPPPAPDPVPPRHPAGTEPQHHRPAGDRDSEVIVAADRRAQELAPDWGSPGSCSCPMCGGQPHPFGRLPEIPWKWCCWDTDHGAVTGGVGLQRGEKWIGDVNDYDMQRLGVGLVELLVREGRLAPRGREQSKRQPQPPQARIAISPEQLAAFEQMLQQHADRGACGEDARKGDVAEQCHAHTAAGSTDAAAGAAAAAAAADAADAVAAAAAAATHTAAAAERPPTRCASCGWPGMWRDGPGGRWRCCRCEPIPTTAEGTAQPQAESAILAGAVSP